MKHRIQKLLAAAGVDSRRHVEEMIRQGRVTVNGKTMTRLPILIDPASDDVAVDGETIKLKKVVAAAAEEHEGSSSHSKGKGKPARRPAGLFYLMLNKPRGVYSTNLAQGEQTRAIDLLPPNFPARVYPVGRLDAESRGLLLLTNDGELTNLLTHPRFGVPKTYRATIDGFVTPEHMTMLEQGVWLVDRDSGKTVKTSRAILKIQTRTRMRTVVDITIKEGKNRQIRRMLARLGHKVRDLNRISFGPLELDNLPNGAVRPLTPAEVRTVRDAAERSKKFFEKQQDAKGESKRKPWEKDAKGGKPSGRKPPAGKSKPAEESLDFVPDDDLSDDD